MMNRSPSEVEVLEAALKHGARKIKVAVPCHVESYNDTPKECSLQPQIKDWWQGHYHRAPKLSGVPVAFPGGACGTFSFDLQKGDTGVALFMDRSMDEYLLTGLESEPAMKHLHDLSDAIFIPFKMGPAALIPSISKVHIDSLGRVYIGNAAVNLLGMVDDLASQVLALTAAVVGLTMPVVGAVAGPAAGPALVPLTAVTTLVTAIKVQLATIKGA